MRESNLHYRPDPLGRLGQGSWTSEARDPLGRLPAEEDVPLARWRDAWPTSEHNINEELFQLNGSVGEGGANDRLDVARVQLALHGEDRFDLDRSGGPTGYFSPPLAEAIRQRQADYDLTVDGVLLPEGETIHSLRTEAAARERDSLGLDLPARPGEARSAQGARKVDGVQLAVAPFLLAPAATFAARWMLQEGAKRAAARLAAELAKREAAAAAQAARSAIAMGAAAPEPQTTPTAAAAATEPPKPELVSEAAVRAWLDAGRAGLALPMAGSRGDQTTERGLAIQAQECRRILKEEWPEFADLIEHEFGSTKDGDGTTYQKEMVIKAKNGEGLLGANRPDQSYFRVGENSTKPKSYFHINSGHVLVDGLTPVSRERRQLVGLAEKVTEALVYFIRKPKKGFDEDEYRAYVRRECRRIMKDQIEKFVKSGPKSSSGK